MPLNRQIHSFLVVIFDYTRRHVVLSSVAKSNLGQRLDESDISDDGPHPNCGGGQPQSEVQTETSDDLLCLGESPMRGVICWRTKMSRNQGSELV